MDQQADGAAAGYWYPHSDNVRPAVAVLDALRRYRAAEQSMRRRTRDAMGMGETDLLALRHLLDAQRDGRVVTATDLARRLEISSASTTVLIDRLARRGHVVRESHPSDRRAVVVVATPASDREVRATLGRMHRAMLEAAGELTPGEAEVVRAFLERMRAAVEES